MTTSSAMSRDTREIAWVKVAHKEFENFPAVVQRKMLYALTFAAEGQKADIAKPMKGLGSGVFEIALPYRGDAYRSVYALKIHDAIWVIHAFQKKAKKGIRTPQQEIDLIKDRIKRLKEQFND